MMRSSFIYMLVVLLTIGMLFQSASTLDFDLEDGSQPLTEISSTLPGIISLRGKRFHNRIFSDDEIGYLVVFTTPYCRPCKKMLEALSNKAIKEEEAQIQSEKSLDSYDVFPEVINYEFDSQTDAIANLFQVSKTPMVIRIYKGRYFQLGDHHQLNDIYNTKNIPEEIWINLPAAYPNLLQRMSIVAEIYWKNTIEVLAHELSLGSWAEFVTGCAATGVAALFIYSMWNCYKLVRGDVEEEDGATEDSPGFKLRLEKVKPYSVPITPMRSRQTSAAAPTLTDKKER